MRTFNVQEAADFLKISDQTLRIMAQAGSIPAAKVRRSWVFTDEGLESYLREEILRQTSERNALTEEKKAYAQMRGKRRRRPIPSLAIY